MPNLRSLALITVLIAHLSWHGWLNGVREMLRGELSPRRPGPMPPEIAPLASELRAGGAEVQVCAGDLSDAGSVRSWVTKPSAGETTVSAVLAPPEPAS